MENNNCTSCSEKQVSWAVVELINGTHERDKRRNWIERIVLIAVILITNLFWLLFFFQYDFESYSYEQDGSGNNVIGNNNRSYIDESKIDYQEETEEAP